MIKRIELLVHVGAPSSRRDDERYRAQMQGYASFQAAVTIPTLRSTHLDHGRHGQVRTQGNAVQISGNEIRHPSELFLEDTQLAYTALDSQILTSSMLRSSGEHSEAEANPDETRVHPSLLQPLGIKRKRDSQSENAEKSHSPMRNSGYEPRDAIPTRERFSQANGSTTSSYLKSPALQRSNKKAKRDVHPARSSSEPVTHGRGQIFTNTSLRHPGQALRTPAPIEDLVDHSHESNGGNQTTSELPTSYSLSDITSGSSKARPNISQRSTSDPGPQLGSISPTALRAVPTPHKTDYQRLEARSGGGSNHGWSNSSAREAVDVERMPKQKLASSGNHGTILRTVDARMPAPPDLQESVGKAAVPNATSSEDQEKHIPVAPGDDATVLDNLSSSIRPRQPPSTVEKFETHVTESLRFLADNTDVNKSYKPVSVLRDIRPLERGYWLVQCPEKSAAWPIKQQIEFWRFLERTVGRGDAGWGVWCTRNDDGTDTTDQQASLGTVKIFCWGEIARHVYLLLYIGSKSKIKKLGLQWIDAEGEVIVQMRHN